MRPELRVIRGTKDKGPISFDDKIEPPGRGMVSTLAILGLWCAIAGGLVAVNALMKLFEK